MKLKLDKRWIALLLNLPESGMGYQRVDVEFKNGKHTEDVVVVNAEVIDLPEEFAHEEIIDIRIHDSVGHSNGW